MGRGRVLPARHSGDRSRYPEPVGPTTYCLISWTCCSAPRRSGSSATRSRPPCSSRLDCGTRSDWNEVADGGHVTIDLGIPGVPPILDQRAWASKPIRPPPARSRSTGRSTSQNFLYAFVAKGFKAGGFNPATATTAQSNFAPEVVWDYELGWKGQYFENHLYTSLDGFWDNYNESASERSDRLHRPDLAGQHWQIGHQGRRGRAARPVWRPRSRHGGGLCQLTPRRDHSWSTPRRSRRASPPRTLPQCAAGSSPSVASTTARTLSAFPASRIRSHHEWTFNAGVQYAIAVGDSASLTPRINYSYIGPQWTTLFEAPTLDYLPSFGLWSSTVTLRRWRHGNSRRTA